MASFKENVESLTASEFKVAWIGGVLELYHELAARRDKCGDHASSDLLMDIDAAFEEADLTDKQREVITLHYFEDVPAEAIAHEERITERAIYYRLERAVHLIAEAHYGEAL